MRQMMYREIVEKILQMVERVHYGDGRHNLLPPEYFSCRPRRRLVHAQKDQLCTRPKDEGIAKKD